MSTFEKTESVMVRPVVEQLRQLILIHIQPKSWRIYGMAMVRVGGQAIRRRQQDFEYLEFKFIKLCLEKTHNPNPEFFHYSRLPPICNLSLVPFL